MSFVAVPDACEAAFAARLARELQKAEGVPALVPVLFPLESRDR